MGGIQGIENWILSLQLLISPLSPQISNVLNYWFFLSKKKHGKNYSGTSDAQRKQIFLNKDAQITKHNSQKNVLYKLGHNEFSDNVIITYRSLHVRAYFKSMIFFFAL